jgi:hypothetical protein
MEVQATLAASALLTLLTMQLLRFAAEDSLFFLTIDTHYFFLDYC